MQLRADIQLSTMIRALTDVIIPAVDSDNQMAMEQSQLIVGMLHLMAHQLPLQYRFDRDELQRLLNSAATLDGLAEQSGHTGIDISASDAQTAFITLKTRAEKGRKLYQQAGTDPQQLVAVVGELREALGAVMTAVAATDNAALLASVEKEILAYSQQQLLRDRALLLPQSWEPDAEALPTIESMLGD